MGLIAQDTARLSNVLKYEFEPASGYCREVITYTAAGTETIVPGTVFGVTSAGVWKVVEATAVDGSEVAAAVSINESDVELTVGQTVKLLVIDRGPAIFAKQGLAVGASVDTDIEKAKVYADLKKVGIKVSDQI